MKLKKLSKQIWPIIWKPIPYAIFNWRYFSKNQNRAIYLHRITSLKAHSNRPSLVRLFLFLYTYGAWLCFLGWIKLWQAWKKNSSLLYHSIGISHLRQLKDLWKLTFTMSTPPRFYYLYQLYKYPSAKWFNFVFGHEIPSWHRTMSPKLSQHSSILLTDKVAFAKEMQEHGLPSVYGQVISKGNNIRQEQLFQKKSVFIKPMCGSRKIDAYALLYDPTTNSYKLDVSLEKGITKQDQILTFLQKLINIKDFVVQPFLVNHPSLKVLYDGEHLITIRLITIWTGSKSEAISAVLFLPKAPYKNSAFALSINLENGEILPMVENAFSIKNNSIAKIKHINGHCLLYWEELLDVALNAHACMPDIFSVGWDLAITPEGVKLIEGNINWGVAPHQLNGPELMPYFVKYAHTN